MWIYWSERGYNSGRLRGEQSASVLEQESELKNEKILMTYTVCEFYLCRVRSEECQSCVLLYFAIRYWFLSCSVYFSVILFLLDDPNGHTARRTCSIWLLELWDCGFAFALVLLFSFCDCVVLWMQEPCYKPVFRRKFPSYICKIHVFLKLIPKCSRTDGLCLQHEGTECILHS